MMLNEDVISGWKFLAEQGTLFHPETVLALIQHIEEQNKIIESMTCEIELRDYIDNRLGLDADALQLNRKARSQFIS
jgi:hypothetical protein